ncbi:uncharacterized protein LOC112128253 isoform X1 [Cimex lectularius]|uniref:Nck-associated protein 5 n=1 Tax=Cimex lectularius TaxID=79782 RepID=A0A8I6SMN4_CIMLE|nr:uncharacterized protein LOC112128253 isoform X1 [Cimex lectularius]
MTGAGGGNVNNNNNNARRSVKSIIIEPSVQDSTVEKIRVSTSPRQVHPVGEKVAMAPAPNICVQGGRIEFIKPNSPNTKFEKEKLEARITELEAQLEEEKKTTLKERRNTARFQALIEDRESLARDVEVERGAREEAESRLLEISHQADRTNARLASLQDTINRLEESLRTMAAYKAKYCQIKSENISLNKVIEARMQQFQSTLSKLSRENEALKAQLHTLEAAGTQEEALTERLRLAEEENSRLLAEREQCEKCLDQVAHQVVQALLSQKELREEISSLRDKVKELEKQNYTLSSLLLQQIPKGPPGKQQNTGTPLEVCVRPLSCDEGKLKWRGDSLFWLPIHRPSSLNLESQRLLLQNGSVVLSNGECHKDEGYSTMSSEVQCESGTSMSQCPLERLQEETTNRLGEDELVVGLRVPKHSFIPRSSSDSALLPYTAFNDEQEWWDPDSTLSRIDFDAPPELEEWNMDDIPGLSFLAEDLEDVWFSVLDGQYGLTSPGADSWSSQTTTSEGSKRSSGAESETTPAVGTQFTRDFYRLVKFESTKSLASTSSRSQVSECGREALQSVLQFIAEQQQYLEEPQAEGGSNDSLHNTDSGVTSNLSSSDEVVKTSESRGLLTVPEEAEEDAGAPETPPIKQLTQVSTLEELHKIVDGGAEDEVPQESSHEVDLQEEETSKPTGWVHLNRPADLTDPKLKANLLEVMSSRSSSSCSGSSESGDDHSPYQHLHRLHRSRRHKKASATRDGAVRVHVSPRMSIIGREDIFTRYGAKEQEAVASFDFLEEITTSSRESTTSRPTSQ